MRLSSLLDKEVGIAKQANSISSRTSESEALILPSDMSQWLVKDSNSFFVSF